MRLSELILEQKESILQEFEVFARTHTSPGESMDIEALRDHAAGMLEAIAHDLEEPQTAAEQERKGKGEAPRGRETDTAAEEHGADRAHSGFSLEEAFAEYRALRASVMRHWDEAGTASSQLEVTDVIRFNEAIDRAIAASVREYSKAVTPGTGTCSWPFWVTTCGRRWTPSCRGPIISPKTAISRSVTDAWP